MRGFDFRKADIGSGVAVAYALMMESAEDEEDREMKVSALRTTPTTLSAVVAATTIEGDETIPTMVPSWWTGDDAAFEEGRGAAAFFRSMPKGGGD